MTTNWRVVHCEGKQAFASWDMANAVRKQRGRRNDKTNRRDVYKCEFCGAWHIGTPGKKREPQRGR
jgi:hypothetical protein